MTAEPRKRPWSGVSRELSDHTRLVFTVLRAICPLIATSRFGVVSRAEDVREVLGDHEHFTVPFYDVKMTEISGPFILGLDDTPLYRHDHAALRDAIRPDDVPALGAATLTAARQRIAEARGRIDIVRELVDPTIVHVITEYFGTPGPDTATQVRWARDIFQEIFLNVGNKPGPRDRALADAAEMRRHIDALVAARRKALDAGEDVHDQVLTRLLTRPVAEGGLHAVAVRHNLIGLIAGWIPTVSKAFACAIEELLRRPAQLRGAQEAARAGDQHKVGAYIFEAMRFRPQTWALLRVCAEDHTVARGTKHATKFRKGSMVLIGTQSAMFDRRAVSSPRSFKIDRPWNDYLHFGHGLHMCFGREINRVHLPALATALLEGPPIEREPGRAGQLSWSGPYPDGLTVSLGSARRT
jgi:cytochrome P450